MGLEVIMHHIGIFKEDTLGSYIGSSDGITYIKNLWVNLWKTS